MHGCVPRPRSLGGGGVLPAGTLRRWRPSVTDPRRLLIKATDIRGLRTAARDYAETERLKADLRDLRRSRRPFHLNRGELDRIFMWKLERQNGRQVAVRDATPDAMSEVVTRAAFEIDDAGSDMEADVRIGLLAALPGVGVPVASAILALNDPDHYCVIDFRGWRAAFGERRSSFSNAQYLDYRRAMSLLGRELGWPVQEVDLAVWAHDSKKNP